MVQFIDASHGTVHRTGAGLAPPPLPPPGAPPPPPPPGAHLEPPPDAHAEAGPPEPGGRSAGWTRYLLLAVAAIATIGVVVVLATLLLPRAELVVESLDVPESVVAGESIPVTAQLTNEGRADGQWELTVLVDGEPLATTPVELEAGGSGIATTTIPDLTPGTHDIALEGWEELGRAVWVMTPATFEVDEVTVSPSPMDINETDEATVLVRLSNVGETEGSHLLELELDGEVVAERTVDDVAGGATAEEPFEVTVDGPGTHEIAVDGRTVSFEVDQLERPTNGTVLRNEIGGGANQLAITNNQDRDVLVVLARPGGDEPALLSVYVHADSSHTIGGLRDGTYVTYFVHGSAWSVHHEEFTQDAVFGRFDGEDVFESTGSTYTVVTLEFGATTGEGVPSQWLSPEDFPAG
jgi:hypothetical protein